MVTLTEAPEAPDPIVTTDLGSAEPRGRSSPRLPRVRFEALSRAPQVVRVVRFAMVSAVAVLVAQGGLTLIYGVFRLPSAVWSNIIAQVISTVPAYYLNRKWVWGKSGRSHWVKEVVPFWAVSLGALGLSIVSVAYAEAWGHRHHLHHGALTALVDIASLVTFAMLWVVKFVSFHKLFHSTHAPEARSVTGDKAVERLWVSVGGGSAPH